MVSAVPFCLSCANKHIHKKRKSPVVTTANYITHNTMVSQASNKLKIMGRKKKQGSHSVKEQSSKNVTNNSTFQRNKGQKWQRLPWTILESASWDKTADDFSSGLKNNWIGFILGVESWNEVTNLLNILTLSNSRESVWNSTTWSENQLIMCGKASSWGIFSWRKERNEDTSKFFFVLPQRSHMAGLVCKWLFVLNSGTLDSSTF